MSGYYQQVVAMLKQHGFCFMRNGKGSHELWGCSGKKPVTVPFNCKSKITANEIMKQAKISHKF